MIWTSVGFPKIATVSRNVLADTDLSNYIPESVGLPKVRNTNPIFRLVN